tara:strand:- start:864 stop:1832 length:969 start_codon:yes stop_codon:yes gene_type:complete
MIGYRSPFRISFVGGGSDIKDFYKYYDGKVFSLTINKYVYILAHDFFYNKIQLKYSKTELVDKINQIEHPIFREVLKKYKVSSLDINSIADIPSKTGLASSSAFTCALIATLRATLKKKITNELVAKEACNIEINKLNNPIGKQDQYGSVFGGLKKITFLKNEKVKVNNIKLSSNIIKNFENHICLYYISDNKNLNQVLTDMKKNLLNKKDKFQSLKEMTDLVDPFIGNLKKMNFPEMGKILNINWQLKKELSNKISNKNIDDIYNVGIKSGAYGGKLLGSGGGGFMLFLCDPKNQNILDKGLKKFPRYKINIDFEGLKRFI